MKLFGEKGHKIKIKLSVKGKTKALLRALICILSRSLSLLTGLPILD
jgi:hypothetical protein